MHQIFRSSVGRNILGPGHKISSETTHAYISQTSQKATD